MIFSKATLLSGSSGFTAGSTLGASKEPFEPAHASDVGGHSVWFSWTSPATGPVDVNTLGSDFDTTLAIYTGNSVTNLTAIAANDDDVEVGGLHSSHLWFFATAGATYRIAVDGFGGVFGNFKLNWNMDSKVSIVSLPDGTFQVGLTGVDWHRYTLMSSTNFLTWFTNNPTITMSGGSHLFTNNPATNAGDRLFLRAIRQP